MASMFVLDWVSLVSACTNWSQQRWGGMVVCRWAVQTLPEDEVVSSAIVKLAAGTPLLAASLTPDALLSEVGTVVLCNGFE